MLERLKLEFEWLKNQYNLIAAAFGGLVLGAVKLYHDQDIALFWWSNCCNDYWVSDNRIANKKAIS